MARFIVFEGIDGSGKSSVAKAVVGKLSGENAILTGEPTKTWLGEAVRRSHEERVDAVTEAFLFLADRTAHTASIRRWLSEGKTVVCDRYFHSTVAYQAAALEGKVKFDPFEWLLEENLRISLDPDVVFFLRVNPEIALRRVNARGSLSKFERLDFLRKVALNYDRLSKMYDNIIVVPSDGPVDSVIADVVQRL
jgi:dTMP kinase